MDIPIIYEDNYLLVVNKPSGLLTVPTEKNEKYTLTGILGFYPCHRLDKETSGLIIYAKNRKIQRKIIESFKKRKIKKTYLALVNGLPFPKEGVIQKRIQGLFAKTYYKVIANKKNFSLVEVKPFTGRTNQIRIHFKSCGFPILGDYRFAFRRDFKAKAKRLMLHAARLEFKHPVTDILLRLECEMPEDIRKFWQNHD